MNFRKTGGIRRLRKRLFPTARQLLVARSLQKIDLSAARKILVVGAGEDPYRGLFDSPESYTCLDIVPKQGVTDVVGDAHRLPFHNGVFDCVLASEVVEHLHHPEQFVDEVFRTLSPGGMLVLTVPFMFHRHADPYDFWRPTPDALQNMVTSFSNVLIESQGNRLHTISDLLTTAFWPWSPFFLFRLVNPILARTPGAVGDGVKSTAPTGYLLVARK